jgi:hypothetical protein
VNGDGREDVVALSFRDSRHAFVVLEARHDGTFVEGEPYLGDASGIALGDVDGDRDLDAFLINGHGRPRYRVAMNDGSGTFEFGPERALPGRYGGELESVALGDLDGDGDLDAAVPLWDSVRVMKGDGRGGFAAEQRLVAGRDPFHVALADLDDDTKLDLVVTSGASIEHERDRYRSGGSSLWIYRGTGRGFRTTPIRQKVPGAKAVAIADFDDNGQLEMAVSHSQRVSVVADPRFWDGVRGWPGAPQARADWLGTNPTLTFEADNLGSLLVADLGPPEGPEIIVYSWMQSRMNIVNPVTGKLRQYDPRGFVIGMYSIDVSGDGTLPDMVLVTGAASALRLPSHMDRTPSISVVFVDCRG